MPGLPIATRSVCNCRGLDGGQFLLAGIRLKAEITMALRRQHKCMEMGSLSFQRRLESKGVGTGYRPRIGVRGRLFAGMTVLGGGRLFHGKDGLPNCVTINSRRSQGEMV